MTHFLKKELKYPFKDLNQFLIGCILHLLSFLIFPWVLIYGYIMRVYRTTVKRKGVPSFFNDFKNLLVDGLKCLLVYFSYLAASVAVFFIAFLLVIQGYDATGSWPSSEEFDAALITVVQNPLMILSDVLFYIGQFLIPAAIILFVRSGSLKSAFDFKLMFKGLSKSMPDYLLIYVIMMAVDYLAAVLSSNLLFNFFQPIIGFYMMVFSARVFAKVYKTNVDKGVA